MSTYKMFDELLHFCTKCRLTLNHRIILLDKGNPTRVLCLTCKTDRAYRAPKVDKPKKDKYGGKPLTPRRAKINEELMWKNKLSSSQGTPQAYNIDKKFNIDSLIKHPIFGVGLVVEKLPPDKMKIYFDDGTKILKCGT